MGCFIFGSGSGGGSNLPFDQVTMEPQFGLAGKKFIDKNEQLKTGTIQNWNGTPLTDENWSGSADIIQPSLPSAPRQYIPAGVYLGKDVLFQSMPEGSVSGAQMGDRAFRITKTAGYISAGTIDIALTTASPTPYALEHNYAHSSTELHLAPMDWDMDDSLQYRMFTISAFAHGSVSNGEIAAFTLFKENGAWVLYVYKMGSTPIIMNENYFSIDYYVRPDMSEYPGYWRLRLTAGQSNCLFSTSKYYEGFGLYL